MDRAVNDPARNQEMFEEVKAKQAAGPGGVSGGGAWLSSIGKGFGFGASAEP